MPLQKNGEERCLCAKYSQRQRALNSRTLVVVMLTTIRAWRTPTVESLTLTRLRARRSTHDATSSSAPLTNSERSPIQQQQPPRGTACRWRREREREGGASRRKFDCHLACRLTSLAVTDPWHANSHITACTVYNDTTHLVWLLHLWVTSAHDYGLQSPAYWLDSFFWASRFLLLFFFSLLFFGSVRHIKLAIHQLLGECKFIVSYCTTFTVSDSFCCFSFTQIC